MRELADILEVEKKRGQGRADLSSLGLVEFSKTPMQTNGILDRAPTWEIRVDLERKLVISGVVQTNLRPDIVICSVEKTKIVLTELTVPWE